MIFPSDVIEADNPEHAKGEANEARKGARKLFCLPSPRPPRGSELTNFIAWANGLPGRLDMPSIDGVFVYLAERFPCPAEAASSNRRAR